jgi:hypothetical protein
MVGRCSHRPAVSSENLAGAAVPPDAEDAIGCEIGDAAEGPCRYQPTVNRSTDDANLRLPFRGRKK